MVAAARAGDEAAFTRLVERHRRELRVHCYRMVGSERADLAAVADLLAADVRAAMPPWTLWLAGRP